MSQTLKQLWVFLTTFLSALTYGAKATENVCIVAEETTAGWLINVRNDNALATEQARKSLAAAKAIK